MKQCEKQGGAVLVVSLLLIFVITVLGMRGLGTSVNESEMSVAHEIEKTTFTVVESALTQAYLSLDPGTLQTGQSSTVSVNSTDSRIAVDVTARLDGMVPVVNSSLSIFGLSSYSIRSVGSNAAVNARRSVVAGVAQRIPLSQ